MTSKSSREMSGLDKRLLDLALSEESRITPTSYGKGRTYVAIPLGYSKEKGLYQNGTTSSGDIHSIVKKLSSKKYPLKERSIFAAVTKIGVIPATQYAIVEEAYAHFAFEYLTDKVKYQNVLVNKPQIEQFYYNRYWRVRRRFWTINHFKEVLGFDPNDELGFLYQNPSRSTPSNIHLYEVPGHKGVYIRVTNRKWKDLLSDAVGDSGSPSRGRKPLLKKSK